jgi:hypothetical protein
MVGCRERLGTVSRAPGRPSRQSAGHGVNPRAARRSREARHRPPSARPREPPSLNACLLDHEASLPGALAAGHPGCPRPGGGATPTPYLACPLILAALAEFDREMIVEGTMEGLACARTPRTSPARRWERRAAGGRRGGRRGLGLECRVAAGPGEARVPRNGPGGARLCIRPQRAGRTRALNCRPVTGSAFVMGSAGCLGLAGPGR